MKLLSKLFAVGFISMGLVACSNEDDLSSGTSGLDDVDKVYMTVDLSYPTTRTDTEGIEDGKTPSTEQPNDFEVGKDVENKISSLQLVFVENGQKPNYAVGNLTPQNTPSSTEGPYEVTFQYDQLVKLAGNTVKIYAVCNGGVSENIEKAINKIGAGAASVDLDAITNSIATNNKFLMTNAKIATKLLPSAEQLKTYGKGNPLELTTSATPIEVERAAARFDYKSKNDGDVYPLFVLKDKKPTVQRLGLQIKLTDIGLTNQSNNFYYLRRVVENLTDGDNEALKGIGVRELSKHYVYDSDWTAKKTFIEGANNPYDAFKTNLLNNFMDFQDDKNNAGLIKYTPITSITVNDNYKQEYNIWTYTSENTIPTKAGLAPQSMATCVIFRGELQVDPKYNTTDQAKLLSAALTTAASDPSKAPFLYTFDNVFYGTWKDVIAESKKSEADPTFRLHVNELVTLTDQVPGTNPEDNEPTAANLLSHGFTRYNYDQSKGCYPVFYYYWNVHNGVDLVEGVIPAETKMYYGVVRNNVYKLMVNTIDFLGHPLSSEVDPNKPDSHDPIVGNEIYFKVSVQVLPWTVRVNNIDF